MVTEYHPNLLIFRITVNYLEYFFYFFQLTCLASSTLDLNMSSLSILCLWISDLGHKSHYCTVYQSKFNELSRSKIAFSFIKVLNLAYAGLEHIKLGHKSKLKCYYTFYYQSRNETSIIFVSYTRWHSQNDRVHFFEFREKLSDFDVR